MGFLSDKPNLATKISLIITLLSLFAANNPTNPPYPFPQDSRTNEYDITQLPSMLPQFYEELTNLVSRPVIGSPNNRRALRFSRNYVYFDQYFYYLRLRCGTHRLTVLIRSTDLYIVGYIVGDRVVLVDHQLHPIIDPIYFDENGIGMMGGIPMEQLVGNDPLEEYGYHNPLRVLSNKARCVLQTYNYRRFEPLSLGDSYLSLEGAAGTNREHLVINNDGLIAAFYGLYNSLSNVEENRQTIARSLLFFTQFVSESLRIRDIQNHVITNFGGNPQPIPVFMLALEHGWGRASYRLNNPESDGPELSYGIEGMVPDVLSLERMDWTYLITLLETDVPRSTPMSMYDQYIYTVGVYQGTIQRRYNRHSTGSSGQSSSVTATNVGGGESSRNFERGESSTGSTRIFERGESSSGAGTSDVEGDQSNPIGTTSDSEEGQSSNGQWNKGKGVWVWKRKET